jgi:hypothetical protein
VEGFKKASFFEKILPEWVEIFSKTRRAWTCFFVNLELTFALFFLFFILISNSKHHRIIGICLKDWKLIWKKVVLGIVSIFCRWMTECDEKENVLYPSEKLILFLLLFDFWGCLNSLLKLDFCIYSEWWTENGAPLQKTMKTLA